MPLSDEQRGLIDTAITAGTQPKRSSSNRTLLPIGGKRYLVLANGGRLTDAGKHYYAQTGHTPPEAGYDRNQPLIKQGRNEYVRATNGHEVLVRKLAADGSVHVTVLGRDSFRRRTEYVVHVPVIIQECPHNRRTLSRLGLGQIFESAALTRAQAVAGTEPRSARAGCKGD